MKRTSARKWQGKAWTIGYEGRTLHEFLSVLKESDIKQVIDVRERPFSRKNGFSKGALGKELRREMILYCHIPELGTPAALRHRRKNGGSLAHLIAGYARHLSENKPAYRILRVMVATKPSAILCFEKDYTACHRQVLARKLETNGFRVEHL